MSTMLSRVILICNIWGTSSAAHNENLIVAIKNILIALRSIKIQKKQDNSFTRIQHFQVDENYNLEEVQIRNNLSLVFWLS